MRQRHASKVHKMFKDVDCPFAPGEKHSGYYGIVNYTLVGPASQEVVVVCFHGFNSSRVMFEGLQQVLVADGFQVLSFDFYGHGLSNAPRVNLWPCKCCRRGLFSCGPPRGRYDLEMFVEQTDDLLTSLKLNHLSLILVGFSLGGAVAVAFAKEFPERVRRLVLMSPAGFMPKLPALHRLLRATWCCLIPAAPHILCRCWIKKEKFPESVALWTRFVWSLFVKHGVASASLAIMLRVPWAGLAPLYQEVGRNPWPKLIVWGETDRLQPWPGAAEEVRDCFCNARLIMIPDAGHIAIADQPRVVLNHISEFLRLPEEQAVGLNQPTPAEHSPQRWSDGPVAMPGRYQHLAPDPTVVGHPGMPKNYSCSQ